MMHSVLLSFFFVLIISSVLLANTGAMTWLSRSLLLNTSKPNLQVPCLHFFLVNVNHQQPVQRLWSYSVCKNAWKGLTGIWPCQCTSRGQDGSTKLEMQPIDPVMLSYSVYNMNRWKNGQRKGGRKDSWKDGCRLFHSPSYKGRGK